MSMCERVLIFIKPDGIRIKEFILSEFQRANIDFMYLGSFTFDDSLLKAIYPQLPERIFPVASRFFVGHNLPIYEALGTSIISKVKVIKEELREKHGNGLVGALLHSSESNDEYHSNKYFLSQIYRNSSCT